MSNLLNINEKYCIPWEVIDFDKLINNCLNPRDSITQLNRTYRDQERFQEYEVYAYKAEEKPAMESGVTIIENVEEQECVIDKYSTYHCHICNTQVPLMYQKAHITSKKHQTCLKIVNTALERVRYQMNQADQDPPGPVVQNTYYCEPCSIVVQTKDKVPHEETKEHRTSANQDKILEKLLKAYIGDVNGYVRIMHEIEVEDKEIVPRFELARYLELLKEEFEMSDDFVTIVDDNIVELKADDGSRVKVTVDQFHGYTDDGGERCIPCRVDIVGGASEHFMSESHMKTVATPVRNMHFIREDIIWSHCILCNQKFFMTDIHIHSTVHKTKLKTVKKDINPMDLKFYLQELKANYTTAQMNDLKYVDDETVEVTATDGSVVRVPLKHFHGFTENMRSCLLCKDDNINDLDKHCLTKGHMDNVIKPMKDKNFIRNLSPGFHCLLCNVPLLISSLHVTRNALHVDKLKNVKEGKTNEPTIVKVPTESDNHSGMTYCKPCNRHIQTHNFASHLNGKLHKEMAELNTNSNNNVDTTIDYHVFLTSVNVTDAICKVCNVHVSKDQFPVHVESPSHLLLWRTLLASNKIKSVNRGFMCTVCDSFVVKSYILNHIKSHTDKAKAETVVTDVKVDKTSDNYCKICACKVPVGGMKVHENGGQHKNRLKLGITNTSAVEGKSILTQPQTVQTPTIHPHMAPTNNPKVFKCTICKVELGKVNIATHVRGLNHTENLNLLLKNNSLKESDEKHFCELCKVDVEHGTESQHIASHTHRMNAARVTSTDNIHPSMRTIDNDKLMCKVCALQVLKTPNHVQSHLHAPAHIQNFTDFLSRNEIKRANDDFYTCSLCMECMKYDDVYDHVTAELHASKTFSHPHMVRTENPKVLMCKVCKNGVPNIKANILEHVDGNAHKANCGAGIDK